MRIRVENKTNDPTCSCHDTTNADVSINDRPKKSLMDSQIDILYQQLLDSPESIDVNATANPSAARRAVDAAQRYQNVKKAISVAIAVSFVLGLFIVIITLMRLLNPDIITKETLSLVFVVVLLACLCLLAITFGSMILFNTYRRTVREALDTIEASSQLIDVESMNTRGVIDLMLNSITRIDRYYDWNISEARNIFWTAIGFSIVGFVLFAVAVYTAIVRGDVNATIPAAVGGAIAELLAHTVLNMYRTSVEQLNHYHQALHEDQRFLASVGVVERLSSDDRRDTLYCDIIHTEMRTTITENKTELVSNMSTEKNVDGT